MINYYLIEVKRKNNNTFLKEIINKNINIYNIRYKKDRMIIKISYDDYKKIRRLYGVKVLRISGKNEINSIIKKYFISIILFLISIFLIIFLSNIVFYINIDTSTNFKKVIISELNKNNLTLFSIKRSDKVLEKIKSNIEQNDRVKWISLKYDGVTLYVEAIENIEKDIKEINAINDIVSSKNAYIRKINSNKGQVLKSVGDYVNKGEVIISGNIIRGENITNQVGADGVIYGEVWYKELYDESIYKKEKIKDYGYKSLIINIFDKDITVFKYKSNIKESDEKTIFNSPNIKIKIKSSFKYKYKSVKQNINDLNIYLLKKGKKDIEKSLNKDEYIIMQKTLKSYVKNDRIYLEVFYKVYENITKKKETLKVEIE